jgi:hypothetical protein
MAISIVNIPSPANEIVYTSTAMGSTVEGIKASSAKVFSIIIDNSANGGAATYVKLFNLASGSVVLGTTVPDEVIYVPAGVVVTHVLYTGAGLGKTFGTALSAAAVTTGGTAGVTAPSSSTVVTINFV